MSIYSPRQLVLAALPGRIDTIRESTGLHDSTVRRWLKRLHKNNECHITNWKKFENGQYLPRFTAGPGEDAKCDALVPKHLHGIVSYSTPPHTSKIVFDSLPGGLVSIANNSVLSVDAIRSNLKKLHKDGEIHIYRWERHKINHRAMPLFAKGPGEDAVCKLKVLTQKQRRRRSKLNAKLAATAKVKADVVASSEYDREINRARKEASQFAALACRTRDPLVMALFGKKNIPNTVQVNYSRP